MTLSLQIAMLRGLREGIREHEQYSSRVVAISIKSLADNVGDVSSTYLPGRTEFEKRTKGMYLESNPYKASFFSHHIN